MPLSIKPDSKLGLGSRSGVARRSFGSVRAIEVPRGMSAGHHAAFAVTPDNTPTGSAGYPETCPVLVRTAGLEPAQPCGRKILRTAQRPNWP